MVGRLLVGFVWLNLQFSVSWLVDFQWGSCGSIFSFLCHDWQTFSGVRVAQCLVFCDMVGRLLVGFVWLNLQFCVMVGRRLVGFVWLNLQFSVLWLVDFQWASCGSIFCLLCHGRQTFNGVRVAQPLVFCVMVGRLLVGFVSLNLQFCVMVGRLLVGFVWLNLQFCVMVGRRLVGFVWLNLQFCVMVGRRLVGFVWLNLQFCVMVGRLLVGFVWLNLEFSVSWLVDFQWGSCGSIFSFLCHGWQTFSGVRVAQSLVFCVMIGRHLVGFVWLNVQFSVTWQVDFQWVSCGSIFSFVSWQVDVQWGSCGSIFSFLCYGWQTFSGLRVAQSFVFYVMVGRLLVGFVWLNLQFSVSWQVDFQWVLCRSIFSFVSWQVDFQWVSCGSIFSFVSWQVDVQWGSCGSIFSFLCYGWQTFSGLRVAQSFVFYVMVGRLLVGFVWLNLLFSVSWQVDFSGVRVGQSSFLCHDWQTFSGVRVAQSLGFCVMVSRLLTGLVWLNLQFSVSWLVDFQWGSCGSILSFLCHDWQTFSGVRVAQSLVFCVMVGRLLVGFVWLNLQLSLSWLVDFQSGSYGSIFSFLCHGWQTFSRVRVAQS